MPKYGHTHHFWQNINIFQYNYYNYVQLIRTIKLHNICKHTLENVDY